MNAEWHKARPVYQTLAPEWYDDGKVVMSQTDVGLAVAVAATLHDGGRWPERAHYLAGRALETMRSMQGTRGVGYEVTDVLAHRIRGEYAQAVAVLRTAIDNGWRINWWVPRKPA